MRLSLARLLASFAFFGMTLSAGAIDIVLVYKWWINGIFYTSEDTGQTYTREKGKRRGYLVVEFDTDTNKYDNAQIIKYWYDEPNRWVTENDFANGNSVFETWPVDSNSYVIVTGFDNNDGAELYSGLIQPQKLQTPAGLRIVNVAKAMHGQSNWDYSIYDRIYESGYGSVWLRLDKRRTNNANFSGQTVDDVVRDLKNEVTTLGYQNQDPIAIDDNVTMEMNESETNITVLSNDYDPQNAQLQINQLLSNPLHGTASINDDGTISYIPDYDWYGVDQFSYEVINQFGSTDNATVTITVTYNRTIQRVSVNSSGAEGTEKSWGSHVTRDGRYVVFMSDDSSFASGSSDVVNIYRYDRGQVDLSNALSLVNYNESALPNFGAQSFALNGKIISDDGANVVFSSEANNLLDYLGLADTNAVSDVFIRNITVTTTDPTADLVFETMVGVNPEGTVSVTNNSTATDTITYLVRPSTASPNWIPNSTQDWVGDSSETIGGGQTIDVPINFQTTGPPGPVNGLSPGVYFVTIEVYNDTDNVRVQEYRLQLTVTAQPITRLSETAAGAGGNGASFGATLSEDSSHAVFYSEANNLVNGDTNGKADVFLKNINTAAIERLSVSTADVQGNGDSYDPSISQDERYVVFISNSTNLIAGRTLNGKWQVYLRDLNNDTTTLISDGYDGNEGNGDSLYPTIDGDAVSGYFVVYSSTSINLDAAVTTKGVSNVYYYNVSTASTQCVSINSSGVEGNGNSVYPDLTEDGNYVVFQSEASNLVTGDNNSKADIFIRNLIAGTTSLITRNDDGNDGNGDAMYPSIGTDGNYLYTSFSSTSSNLVNNDDNGVSDVFVVKQKDLNK